MADRDMQMVRVIVTERLPVKAARTDRDSAQQPQILEAIRFDLVFIWRHHLGDAWKSRFQGHEQKPVPVFERYAMKPKTVGLKAGIFVPVRNPDQSAVAGIAPCVIGTGQHFRATARTVDQSRAAMAANVRECSHLAVVAPDHDDAFTEIFE